MTLFKGIPKEFKNGYKLLFTLSDNDFTAVMDAIGRTSFTSSPFSLAAKIVGETEVSTGELEEILMSAGSLCRFLERDHSVTEIVDELLKLLVAGEVVPFQNDEDKSKFSERLTALLNSQQLFVAAKAVELITESGNVHIQSRLITDMRPVFNLKIEDAPRAGVIMHTLHIHYRSDMEGDHRDMFFSLDSKDILALKKLLDRAEKKETNLKSVLEQAGMINLNE